MAICIACLFLPSHTPLPPSLKFSLFKFHPLCNISPRLIHIFLITLSIQYFLTPLVAVNSLMHKLWLWSMCTTFGELHSIFVLYHKLCDAHNLAPSLVLLLCSHCSFSLLPPNLFWLGDPDWPFTLGLLSLAPRHLTYTLCIVGSACSFSNVMWTLFWLQNTHWP